MPIYLIRAETSFEAFLWQNIWRLCFTEFTQNIFERKIAGEFIIKALKHTSNKFGNAGGTCASSVGFLAQAGGEFATAPLSKHEPTLRWHEFDTSSSQSLTFVRNPQPPLCKRYMSTPPYTGYFLLNFRWLSSKTPLKVMERKSTDSKSEWTTLSVGKGIVGEARCVLAVQALFYKSVICWNLQFFSREFVICLWKWFNFVRYLKTRKWIFCEFCFKVGLLRVKIAFFGQIYAISDFLPHICEFLIGDLSFIFLG